MAGVFELVNEEREKAGVPPLKWHEGLHETALIKSKDMAGNSYYAQQSPTFGSPQDLLDLPAYPLRWLGESLRCLRYARKHYEGLDESPGNRNNILCADYKHLGIGSYKGASYRMYHTQIFIKEK